MCSLRFFLFITFVTGAQVSNKTRGPRLNDADLKGRILK